MNTLFPIAGVGLGPGDPDLITVKGLNMLNIADVIYYPASCVDDTGIASFSLPILQKLNVGHKSIPMHLPMNAKDRDKYYLEAYSIIRQSYEKGLKVVVVSEGDILFYSTFGYLLRLAKQDKIPFYLIPGIPAFVLGASVMGDMLAEGSTPFSVVALPKSFSEIDKRLDSGENVVVMKPKALKGWFEYLSSSKRPFFYAEYLGTPKEYTTVNCNDLYARDIPYFAVVIFTACS